MLSLIVDFWAMKSNFTNITNVYTAVINRSIGLVVKLNGLES
jgi:hypothetical protein